MKSAADLLGGGDLGKLAARARRQRDLADELRTRLPPEVAEHLVAARVEDGRLVVAMDAPAWAARIRYMQTELGRSEPLRVKVIPPGR